MQVPRLNWIPMRATSAKSARRSTGRNVLAESINSSNAALTRQFVAAHPADLPALSAGLADYDAAIATPGLAASLTPVVHAESADGLGSGTPRWLVACAYLKAYVCSYNKRLDRPGVLPPDQGHSAGSLPQCSFRSVKSNCLTLRCRLFRRLHPHHPVSRLQLVDRLIRGILYFADCL